MTQRRTGRSISIKSGLIALLLVVLPVTASVALAQTGASFTLAWWTVDNGGGQSSNGTFTVVGTVGQPEADKVMSGGQLALQGGFWSAAEIGVAPPGGDQHIFLPLIAR